MLGHDEVIATLARAVKKHPRTTFIACHFATIPRSMASFYARYQDRLLYGTDMGTDAEMYRATCRILETTDEHFYLEPLRLYHWPYHGFGLPEAILRKVCRENAQKILHQPRV